MDTSQSAPVAKPVAGSDLADLVLRFINTRTDGAGSVERFGTAATFRDWAAEQGLLAVDAVIAESDAAAAREVREALVTIFLAHNGGADVEAEQVTAAERYLRQAGERYHLVPVITAGSARLQTACTGAAATVSTVLAAATELALQEDWARIKACSNSRCQIGFLDRTRNRSGRYCSTGCNSQVSMRAYRRRQGATAAQ
ncbi:CGNR zinc finger domain-containing protein [Streptomyces sp. NPDC057062]|uniref:CGNR zinc finger domain-containing protein n=1 Tax=Streptomyces sp. NPDC057062 TaxID=3346011 RepID=UPI0036369AA6